MHFLLQTDLKVVLDICIAGKRRKRTTASLATDDASSFLLPHYFLFSALPHRLHYSLSTVFEPLLSSLQPRPVPVFISLASPCGSTAQLYSFPLFSLFGIIDRNLAGSLSHDADACDASLGPPLCSGNALGLFPTLVFRCGELGITPESSYRPKAFLTDSNHWPGSGFPQTMRICSNFKPTRALRINL